MDWGRYRAALYSSCSLFSCTRAVVCFRAFVDANVMKKRRQQVFDQLGGFSQQGAVCSILGKDLYINCSEIVLFCLYLRLNVGSSAEYC